MNGINLPRTVTTDVRLFSTSRNSCAINHRCCRTTGCHSSYYFILGICSEKVRAHLQAPMCSAVKQDRLCTSCSQLPLQRWRTAHSKHSLGQECIQPRSGTGLLPGGGCCCLMRLLQSGPCCRGLCLTCLPDQDLLQAKWYWQCTLHCMAFGFGMCSQHMVLADAFDTCFLHGISDIHCLSIPRLSPVTQTKSAWQAQTCSIRK